MNQKIGFLGGGRMASAIADGLLAQSENVEILVSDPALESEGSEPKWGDRRAEVLSAEQLFERADWLVWSIKPQVFNSVFSPKSLHAFKGVGMISVMAGIKAKSIEAVYPGVPVVRTMPNTPMMYGQGMVALSKGAHASDEHLKLVESLFQPVAQTMVVDEVQMDGVTAVSGSGPAYVFRLAEEVVAQSSSLGLEPEQALKLWLQTLKGAAAMLEGPQSPKALKEQVTSPGGTTQAALETFEAFGLGEAFAKGLRAAHQRSIELG